MRFNYKNRRGYRGFLSTLIPRKSPIAIKLLSDEITARDLIKKANILFNDFNVNRIKIEDNQGNEYYIERIPKK